MNNIIDKVVIIGSGVVGTATGKGLLEHGYNVIFCDTNPKKIKELKQKDYNAFHINELKDIKNIKIFFICVQTISSKKGPNIQAVEKAADIVGKIIRNQRHFSVVAIKSTVPPGTAKNIIIPLLEKSSGKKNGTDFEVCSNPEYLREKSALLDFKHPRVIIIGSENKKLAQILGKIYEPFNSPIIYLRNEEAEMHKYAHNLFNACKISFFNEQRIICNKLKINADRIFSLVVKSAEASWNPKYGIKNLGAFNRSCLPKDTVDFLNWTNSFHKIKPLLLQAIIEVNNKLDKLFLKTKSGIRKNCFSFTQKRKIYHTPIIYGKNRIKNKKLII